MGRCLSKPSTVSKLEDEHSKHRAMLKHQHSKPHSHHSQKHSIHATSENVSEGHINHNDHGIKEHIKHVNDVEKRQGGLF